MKRNIEAEREALHRWIRVLDLHEWDHPVIFEHCLLLGHLRTPLDFYTKTWGPRLEKAINRTRDLPLAKFLRALGYENIGDAQVAKLRKHVGGIEKLMRWAAKGEFKSFQDHDLGKGTIIRVRDLLQQNQDLVEALLEEIEVS